MQQTKQKPDRVPETSPAAEIRSGSPVAKPPSMSGTVRAAKDQLANLLVETARAGQRPAAAKLLGSALTNLTPGLSAP